MPTSPNSLMMTAVSLNAGSARRRRSSVVLPEPRKPVSKVTGVKSGMGSAIAALKPGEKIGRQGIAEAAGQSFCGWPEMAEILDHLALAGERRQKEGRALPIGKTHAVMRQYAIGDSDALGALLSAAHGIGVARVDSLARRRVRPMLGAAEDATKRAHLVVLSPTSCADGAWRNRPPFRSW